MKHSLLLLFAAALIPAAGCSQAHPPKVAAAATVKQAAANSTVMTVDLTGRGRPLKKPGLGSLFGVSAIAGGTPKELLAGSVLNVAASQGRIGENGSNPFSTEAVAPLLRGTGARMVCRFNDLCYGFDPYVWPGLAEWLRQVKAASQAVSTYQDVVYAVAPFNEPDNKFWREGTPLNAFMNDPALPAGSYDAKVNWLWTQTVKQIKSVNPTVKIMGPNFEDYRAWEADGKAKARMEAFLTNAMATDTVPDIIGWHSLGPSPGDAPFALSSFYRPLEETLKLPGRPKPISIEEYGPSSGEFEGVPGTMVKHWAELERSHIDFAGMGIYANGGLLGNTLRYAWQADPKPNSGWQFMHWYRQMTGEYIPVSRWDTRHYQSFDGVAGWDSAAKTLTVLLGGADENADVQVLGVKAAGLGPTVRVRLDCADWDTASDTAPEHGGDPKSGTQNIYDKIMTLDASGNLQVPIHRLDADSGYRLLISPAAPAAAYPGKYEAEAARLTHGTLHNGVDAAPLASGNAYVGGLDFPDSSLTFAVTAPTRGIYLLTVRYANGSSSSATQAVRVGGVPQGSVTYVPTNGWSNTEMRTVTKRVALRAGRNTLTLAHGTGSAEIDYIALRPDTHRYEAEFAMLHNVKPASFAHEINVANYVGGIDSADSFAEFTLDAPQSGRYQLQVGYANGTSGPSTLSVSVDGGPISPATFPATSGWFSAPDPRTSERTVTVPVTLHAGLNKVRFQKANGFVELDYVSLVLQ